MLSYRAPKKKKETIPPKDSPEKESATPSVPKQENKVRKTPAAEVGSPGRQPGEKGGLEPGASVTKAAAGSAVAAKKDAKSSKPVQASSRSLTLKVLAGKYRFRPNPLVTEFIELHPDGRFTYSDSNGAKVLGKAQLKHGHLTLEADEVKRQFSVSIDGPGLLRLTKREIDKPRILNDLATMSPSVKPSAAYERQQP